MRRKGLIRFILNVTLVMFMTFRHVAVYAQNWPALFQQQDFMNIPEKKSKQKNIIITEKNIESTSPEEVRKKLHDSFYFMYDFVSATRNDRPKNWIDGTKDPQQALQLGYPEPIKRSSNTFRFPVYPLYQIAYFRGDSEINASINVCITYWSQGDLQETLNCLTSLQHRIEKGIGKITSKQKMLINLLEAFFLLNVVANNDLTLKNISFSTDPPSLIRFKPGEVLSITKTLFQYISSHYKDALFLPKEKSSDILPFYGEMFQKPFYLTLAKKPKGIRQPNNNDQNVNDKSKTSPGENSQKNSAQTDATDTSSQLPERSFVFSETSPKLEPGVGVDPKVTVNLLNKALDPMSWIRTVLPFVYLNILGLNDKISEFEKTYSALEKYENYLDKFNFPQLPKKSAIVTPKHSFVEEDIYLRPVNNLDALVMADVFRSLAYQAVLEPDTALKSIAKGILRNGDPDLSSVLFKTAADGYFDLDILQLARKSYSWSELYSYDFGYKVPAILFFGAESAFWLGQYETAKKGFERFLLATADKEYAPRAMLRIGYIDQLSGDLNSAQSTYHTIIRNFGDHPVTQDAAVNLFCINVDQLTPKVKELQYKTVVDKIKFSRLDLKRQAKACMVKSDLADETKKSFQDVNKSVVEKAKIQKDIIDKYKKEFDESEFMVLFNDRMKQLELADAAWLAWQNKCSELLTFYKENKKKLKNLSKVNNKYVAGLKWDKEERTKVLRCAALMEDLPIWKEARKFDVGKDGNPMQERYFQLVTKPSSKTALDMYFQLKDKAKEWENSLTKVEDAGTEITDDKNYWEQLSLQKFLNYEFVANASTKNILSKALVKDLIQTPKILFERPIFCSWLMRQMDNLNGDDLDVIAKFKTTSQWLDLLQPQAQGTQCELTMAKNLLAKSVSKPSETRDNWLLLPYLEKQGLAEASEDWLVYAGRLEKEKGTENKEVIDIYTKLSQEAKDENVKTAAKLWLNKNFPNPADKVLW